MHGEAHAAGRGPDDDHHYHYAPTGEAGRALRCGIVAPDQSSAPVDAEDSFLCIFVWEDLRGLRAQDLGLSKSGGELFRRLALALLA
jgi:hypothetical protein